MRCRYSMSIDRSRGRLPSSARSVACSSAFRTLPLGKAAPLRRPDPGWIARPVAPRVPELPFIPSFMLASLLVYVHTSGFRRVPVEEELACWHTICHMFLQVERRPWPTKRAEQSWCAAVLGAPPSLDPLRPTHTLPFVAGMPLYGEA